MKEYLQLSDDERLALEKNFLKEPDTFYQKAETDLVRDALKLSYTERFLVMTTLMKRGMMLSNAKITLNNSSFLNPE